MSSALNRKVLVLNKHWRAAGFTTVKNALHRMSKPKIDSNYVLALYYRDGEYFPTEWEDWINLPVTEQDHYIQTPKKQILAPSIIIAQRLIKIPVISPKMTKLGLWKRQKSKCMYTGELLNWSRCNIDHYIPRTKGGVTSWENCGLTKIATNEYKGDKLAHEVGLKLNQPLTSPPPLLLSYHLINKNNFDHREEWEPFLKEVKSTPY